MCVYFNKIKYIKIEIMKNQYNYNVMLSGWIIINIIKLIVKYIFCKYQFYYLTYNILKINSCI
jgi:hypothetical protein